MQSNRNKNKRYPQVKDIKKASKKRKLPQQEMTTDKKVPLQAAVISNIAQVQTKQGQEEINWRARIDASQFDPNFLRWMHYGTRNTDTVECISYIPYHEIGACTVPSRARLLIQ